MSYTKKFFHVKDGIQQASSVARPSSLNPILHLTINLPKDTSDDATPQLKRGMKIDTVTDCSLQSIRKLRGKVWISI